MKNTGGKQMPVLHDSPWWHLTGVREKEARWPLADQYNNKRLLGWSVLKPPESVIYALCGSQKARPQTAHQNWVCGAHPQPSCLGDNTPSIKHDEARTTGRAGHHRIYVTWNLGCTRCGMNLNFLVIINCSVIWIWKKWKWSGKSSEETNVRIRKTVESVDGILIHLQISFALFLNISNEEFFQCHLIEANIWNSAADFK